MLIGCSVGVGVGVTVGVCVKVGELVPVAVAVGLGVAGSMKSLSVALPVSAADGGSLAVWLEQAEVTTSRTRTVNQ